MDNFYVCLVIMLCSVLIAGLSQLILKKAAVKSYDKWYKQYLNVAVISGYFLMFASTVCSVIAYRVLPLSMAPIWTAAGQVFVALLSWLVLKEKLTKRKLIGLGIIVVGIAVFCL